MENIYKTDNNYDFSKLKLITPKGIQGGAFFSKLLFDEKTVLIQMPKCFTKDGIHKTDKRIYCDLKFNNDDDIFFNWIKDLEERVQNLIYEKSNIWFHNEMDMDSIEYHWQSLLRSYRKNSHLLRCFIQKPRNFNSAKFIQIFDEQENPLTLDNIKTDKEIVSILEIKGLKFTTQSFCLEFYLRQIMVLENKPLFNKCLISLNNLKDLEKTKYTLDNKINLSGSENIKDDTTSNLNDTTSNLNVDNSIENTISIKPDNTSNLKDDTSNFNVNTSNLKDDTSNFNVNTSNLKDDTYKLKDDNSIENTSSIKPDNTYNLKDDTYNLKDDIPVNDNSIQNNIQLTENFTNKNQINEKKNSTADETLEEFNILDEININLSKKENSMKLKPAKEVYFEIYKEARKRAKEAKKKAIKTYLEAKKIKSTYLLDDIESSDDDLDDLAELFD